MHLDERVWLFFFHRTVLPAAPRRVRRTVGSLGPAGIRRDVGQRWRSTLGHVSNNGCLEGWECRLLISNIVPSISGTII